MTKRIKITTLQILPGRYGHCVAKKVTGYRPTPSSRFAVVRVSADSPWRLIHVKSGSAIDSLLGSRSYSLAEKLAVAAAFEAATHLDWAPFDALPEVTPESRDIPAWGKARPNAAELSAFALAAIAALHGEKP